MDSLSKMMKASAPGPKPVGIITQDGTTKKIMMDGAVEVTGTEGQKDENSAKA
jgi:hypothetical protein